MTLQLLWRRVLLHIWVSLANAVFDQNGQGSLTSAYSSVILHHLDSSFRENKTRYEGAIAR